MTRDDVTARSAISTALAGVRPYDQAAKVLEALERHGFEVTPKTPPAKPGPVVVVLRALDPDDRCLERITRGVYALASIAAIPEVEIFAAIEGAAEAVLAALEEGRR